jgi:hypothetical protein
LVKDLIYLLPGRTEVAIWTRAEKLGLKKDFRWSAQEIRLLKEKYKETSFEDLQTLFPSRSIISLGIKGPKVLREAGKPRKKVQAYSVDHNFFSKLTIESAYWAGFLAADATLYKNQIIVNLKRDDAHHLEVFKKSTQFEGPITFHKRFNKKRKKFYYSCKIVVTSQKWVENLSRFYNIISRKSLILQPPRITDDQLLKAFCVGYIDGDGCVHKNKRGNWSISAVGTQIFLTFVKEFFDVVFPHRFSGSISRIKNSSSYVFQINHKKSLLVARQLYKLNLPVLARKWSKIFNDVKELL